MPMSSPVLGNHTKGCGTVAHKPTRKHLHNRRGASSLLSPTSHLVGKNNRRYNTACSASASSSSSEAERAPRCEWHAPEGLQCLVESSQSAASGASESFSPARAVGALARTTSTEEAMRNALARSAERCRARGGVPVTVMLPLDCVDQTGLLRYASQRWFEHALKSLKAAGCSGVMVDVWWGAVERSPGEYDWAPYRQLLEQVRRAGLRLQVVMAFHACGGNVNDTVNLPLPRWVLDAGDDDPDLWYTDRGGNRNRECISLFADEQGSILGRTPLQCYEDFMRSFGDAFERDLQRGGAISEVLVGCGPCGELRYPSYPEALGWRFPGVGEFQCYDKRALASLAEAAEEFGQPEWGLGGPDDAGWYNAKPHEASFFAYGRWNQEYGRFFLGWYGHQLLAHGERLMGVADRALRSRFPHVMFGMKCAGVHWWHGLESRPAALTAGYCPLPLSRASELLGVENKDGDKGEGDEEDEEEVENDKAVVESVPFYTALARLFNQNRMQLAFTCVEMAATDHPAEFACAPESLLREVRLAAALEGVSVLGENALEVYGRGQFNHLALERMVTASRPISVSWHEYSKATSAREAILNKAAVISAERDVTLPPLTGLTFLRLSMEMMRADYVDPWSTFVRAMNNPSRGASSPGGANNNISTTADENLNTKPSDEKISV